MAIFKCESCGYERNVPGKLLGKKAKCPDCGHGVTIVNFVPAEEASFEADFENSELSDLDGEREASDRSGSEPFGSIDLDSGDGEVDLGKSDDLICPGCGFAMAEDYEGDCQIGRASCRERVSSPV